MQSDKNLVWIDLEMTGLNVQSDVILEIATVITDSDLTILEHGPSLIINQPETALEVMNEVVVDMHSRSGLLDRVRHSTTTVQQAEEQTLAVIKKYCAPGTALLAGNSVWQDKQFLAKYMPRIADYLFYRIVDVTTIKELVSHWYPNDQNSVFEKEETHRAAEDIKESIEELKYYRKHFFIKET